MAILAHKQSFSKYTRPTTTPCHLSEDALSSIVLIYSPLLASLPVVSPSTGSPKEQGCIRRMYTPTSLGLSSLDLQMQTLRRLNPASLFCPPPNAMAQSQWLNKQTVFMAISYLHLCLPLFCLPLLSYTHELNRDVTSNSWANTAVQSHPWALWDGSLFGSKNSEETVHTERSLATN